MAPSSSANKVAKLAAKGKGKKVRFASGGVFPLVVVGVVILGLLGVVYARQSLPPDGSGSPAPGEHWHAAFAVRVCDRWEPKLVGNAEETEIDPATGNERFTNRDFEETGIHSHNDGVMHWHPSGTKAAGNRAKLGVFLDVYDIELTDDSVTFPTAQGGVTYSTDDTTCDGKPTELKVTVWDNFDKPGESRDIIEDFRNIRITRNGMVMVVAIVPVGEKVPFPGFACGLAELGASDGGDDLTSTTLGTGSTVTTVAGAATTSTTPTGLNDFECIDFTETSTTASTTTTTIVDTTAVPSETTAPDGDATTTTGG